MAPKGRRSLKKAKSNASVMAPLPSFDTGEQLCADVKWDIPARARRAIGEEARQALFTWLALRRKSRLRTAPV